MAAYIYTQASETLGPSDSDVDNMAADDDHVIIADNSLYVHYANPSVIKLRTR